jgi:RNA recognition motif-containing protein
MGKKLYVGGIAYRTTQDNLREAFEAAGPVASASIIMDRETGRSKGFGFVEMETDEDALKAIDMFNGKEIDGRRVTVNEARPPERRNG